MTKRNTFFIAFPIIMFLLLSGVTKGQDSVSTINISLTHTFQRIDNFAASDAWACQFVGNWPDEKKNKIADFLFSNDTLPNGAPKGISLSAWRFNIGAGSAAQGEQSDIKDEWRRAESFLNNNGNYNWQQQAGQDWFLKAAKKRGVKTFIGFANSPPVQLTLNGKAYATKGKTNIAPANYNAFSTYLVKVIKGVEQSAQIKFNYISPVNEPQWDWSDAGQEGCPYNNTEIAGLVKSINTAFVKHRIKSKLLITEAGKLNYLIEDGDKPGKGKQIFNFFKKESPNYIGNLPTVSKTIAGHSYFTTSPATTAIKTRVDLAKSVAAIPSLSYWQSEYCILGDNAGELNGEGKDTGIDAALYLAAVIHTDMAVANASAWQWWTAISAYNYKDGLIYADKNKTDGNFSASKMLWVLGNYSRFIRPGAVRIEAAVTGTQNLKMPLLVSACKYGKSISIVIINKNSEQLPVRINIDKASVKNIRAYTTSQTDDLLPGKILDAKKPLVIQGRSVVTITGKID